jgi:type VI protein secretion system component VasF
LAALHQLEDDRHIIKVQANYGITAKGQKFLREGSYRVIHEKESKRDAYTDQLQESLLETNKATTNNFRVTERNFRITIRLTIIAIFVSGIVALSSVIDYFSLKQQSKQLQTQLQVLKQM